MLPLLLSLLLAGPAPRPPHTYADPVRRRIATLQDERNGPALLPFLQDKNPAYRRAAALALASVQDPKATPALLPLLADAVPAVRRAAAFALGQGADSLAAPALAARLTRPEADAAARRATYEALGRCATRRTVASLWQTPPADPAARAGLAWGLYRATVRGLASPDLIRRATALLTQSGAARAARQGASAVFARARGLDSAVAQVAVPTLLKLLAADPDYFVRANCAAGLGRVARLGAYQALLQAAETDADFRVRVAALRALPGRFAVETALLMSRSLAKPLAQEVVAASEWPLRLPVDSIHGKGDFRRLISLTMNWRARAMLLQVSLRHARPTQRPVLADTIRRRYGASLNPYERAALLMALGEDPAQFDFLAQEAAKTGGPPVVLGAALAALVALRQNKNFPAARQADYLGVLRRALAGGDVAQLGTAAEALADSKLQPAPGPDELTALRAAQQKLTLPRDVEAWLALQQTLDKLEKKSASAAPPAAGPRHPIDWALVQRIPVGQRVRLTTTQGVIVLELKVEEAPGSVATFVSLVQRRFYDGLYFHRVVPNFVAQGGDPRGDGSGGLDYTLRSEFSELTYGAGAVGLASAGKDTESCQFFFTHLPTPHLDGRYTIFAQVVAGLDVVQRLEIGDKMLTATLLPR